MLTTENAILDDAALEAFFVAGRSRAPEPSAGLMASILAGADAELEARRPAPSARGAVGQSTWGRSLSQAFLEAIGGWRAVASLVTAAVMGVSVGIAAPAQVETVTGGLISSPSGATSYELEAFLPGYSGFAALSEEVSG